MAIVCGKQSGLRPRFSFQSDPQIACLPSLRPIFSLVLKRSPNKSHDPKHSSYKHQVLDISSKNSRRISDTIDKPESQRGFVALSGQSGRTETTVTRVESYALGQGNSFGCDIEMQGLSSTYKGIHVRNDMSVDWTENG